MADRVIRRHGTETRSAPEHPFGAGSGYDAGVPLKDEDRAHLERLLDLGDRLNRLQRAIDDEMSGRRPEGSVRERMRKAVEQATADGILDAPLPGALGRLE